MQIHKATQSHLKAICDISNWAIENTASSFQTDLETIDIWRDRWEQEHEHYPWFVAEDEKHNQIVGFCRAMPFGGRCATAETAETSIYVFLEHQRKGIARALYAALIEAFKEAGFRSAVARIMSPNTESERLHAAMGFQCVGVVREAGRKNNRWYDVGYWQLMLANGHAAIAANGAAHWAAGRALDHEMIRQRVSKTYATAVSRSCARTGANNADERKGVAINYAGYGDDDFQSLPAETVVNAFGCGNPLAFAEVQPGETVLDLGSGAGIDLLLASDRVGPNGHVIGVDMTDEMIARARQAVSETGRSNIEIRKGLIESLPVATESVDWVISNCVINLSPDKKAVFREIARVLKPGGRMLISDIVARNVPQEVRDDPGWYDCCLGGAISEEEYVRGLEDAGLVHVTVCDRIVYGDEYFKRILPEPPCDVDDAGGACCGGDGSHFISRKAAASLTGNIWSAHIRAEKPACDDCLCP